MNPRAQQDQRKESAFRDTNKVDLRNEIQAEYGSQPVPWFDWIFDSFDLLNHSQVLELGCGSGSFWKDNETHLPKGWNIFLSDLTPDIVRGAKANLETVPRRFHYLDVDSQSLPFPAESFDAVLAIGLLDLVPDLNQALSEIWRVLRPGGQFLASAGGKGHLHELEERLIPFIPKEVGETLGGKENHFGMENGETLLAPYFEEVVRLKYNDQMVFNNLQPILDYVLSEQAIVWAMPLDKLGKFVQSIKQELVQHSVIDVTIHKGLFIGKKKVIGNK